MMSIIRNGAHHVFSHSCLISYEADLKDSNWTMYIDYSWAFCDQQLGSPAGRGSSGDIAANSLEQRFQPIAAWGIHRARVALRDSDPEVGDLRDLNTGSHRYLGHSRTNLFI